LTTFFSKAKFAAEISTLINVILSLSYFVVLISHDKYPESVDFNQGLAHLYGLIPHYTIVEGFLRLISGNENKAFGSYMLLFDTILYLFLFYYFDNIFPNTYGVKKSACFCFKKEE
jgi:hypothetical protein